MRYLALFVLSAFTVHRCSATLDCAMEFRCHDHKMNEKINNQIAVELGGHHTYLYMAQRFEHHSRYYPKVAKYFRAKSLEELSHAERFIQYQNQRGGNVIMEDPVGRYTNGHCGDVTTLKQAFQCAMELEAHVTSHLTNLHQDASVLRYNEGRNHGECPTVPAIADDDLRLTQPILVTVSKFDESEETVSYDRECGCGTDTTNCYVVSFSYVELAEMIAHEFLDHQLEDTKEIANYYNTLKRMETDNAALASWLFDQHLEL